MDRKIVYNHIHDAHRKLKKAELSAFICVGYFEFPAAFLSEKSQLNKIKTIQQVKVSVKKQERHKKVVQECIIKQRLTNMIK